MFIIDIYDDINFVLIFQRNLVYNTYEYWKV